MVTGLAPVVMTLAVLIGFSHGQISASPRRPRYGVHLTRKSDNTMAERSEDDLQQAYGKGHHAESKRPALSSWREAWAAGHPQIFVSERACCVVQFNGQLMVSCDQNHRHTVPCDQSRVMECLLFGLTGGVRVGERASRSQRGGSSVWLGEARGHRTCCDLFLLRKRPMPISYFKILRPSGSWRGLK